MSEGKDDKGDGIGRLAAHGSLSFCLRGPHSTKCRARKCRRRDLRGGF